MGVKAARRAAGRVRAAGASGAGAAGGAAVLAIRQVVQRGPHKLQWELQRGGETAGGPGRLLLVIALVMRLLLVMGCCAGVAPAPPAATRPPVITHYTKIPR